MQIDDSFNIHSLIIMITIISIIVSLRIVSLWLFWCLRAIHVRPTFQNKMPNVVRFHAFLRPLACSRRRRRSDDDDDDGNIPPSVSSTVYGFDIFYQWFA